MADEGGDGSCPGRAQRLETSRGTPEKGHQELGELATRLDREVAEVARNMELLRKKNSVLLWRRWKINLKTVVLMKLSFPQPQYTIDPQSVRRGACCWRHCFSPGRSSEVGSSRPRCLPEARVSSVLQPVPAEGADAESKRLLISVTAADFSVPDGDWTLLKHSFLLCLSLTSVGAPDELLQIQQSAECPLLYVSVLFPLVTECCRCDGRAHQARLT